jgi:hypothetical protein
MMCQWYEKCLLRSNFLTADSDSDSRMFLVSDAGPLPYFNNRSLYIHIPLSWFNTLASSSCRRSSVLLFLPILSENHYIYFCNLVLEYDFF